MKTGLCIHSVPASHIHEVITEGVYTAIHQDYVLRADLQPSLLPWKGYCFLPYLDFWSSPKGRNLSVFEDFFAVPALQQVSWIEARLRVFQKGCKLWWNFNFTERSFGVLPAVDAGCWGKRKRDNAGMEPSFLQLPMICSSGNTWARNSFCMSSNLQGSLYSQQK